MALTTRKMSKKHEEYLAERLGGERTRNSGAVWSDQGDGHQMGMDGHWRFGWDGKATLGKSISITREMWAKLLDQCRGLEPMIPLRWYASERLDAVDIDLVAIELETFAQMQEEANLYRLIKETGCAGGIHAPVGIVERSTKDPMHKTVPWVMDATCKACGLSGYEQGVANDE